MLTAEEYLKKILSARVYDVAIESPLEKAPKLSERTDNTIWLKREDMQPVFSFKLRGAYNKMSSLSAEELARGVVASSAGNHAQGVALAAQKLGCKAQIVMPRTTPEIKVEAVKSLGAEVILKGDSYDDAQAFAQQMVEEENLVFIAPYDDPEVIAGQGTIALEIHRQLNDIDMVFVPIGGGGLMAGISTYLKQVAPKIKLIGVEPDDAASMKKAFAAGEPIALEHVGLFADGVAVKKVGEETYRLCSRFVDEIITVNTDECCAAIKDIFEDCRSIVEPAGALAVAGIKKYAAANNLHNKNLVALTCGANMNFDRLKHVSERAEMGEHREALLAVTLKEEPGSFKAFCSLIGDRNITEFNYRHSGSADAHVFVGVSIKAASETKKLVDTLTAQGMETIDLSDNEMAKVHLRHIVGGRAANLTNERLYRFIFPERPGALMKFLNTMPEDWNISLFHYRNHGSNFGRVLAGIQIPDNDYEALSKYFKELGYSHWEETDNPAYKLFLA